MDFRQDFPGQAASRPIIDEGEGGVAIDVAYQPGRDQARIAGLGLFPVIGMSRQQKSQQSASPVAPPVYYAGGDFPVHVPSLPGAETDQDDGDGSVRNVVVSNPSADLVQRKPFVVDVSLTDGLVDELAVQRLHESVLVRLVVVVMVADKDLVSGNAMRRHGHPLDEGGTPYGWLAGQPRFSGRPEGKKSASSLADKRPLTPQP